MISNFKMDKTNGPQKFLAVALLAGLVYGAIKVLNNIIPPVNELIGNIWKLLLYGGPLALIAIYVISNPTFVWGLFKTLSWKLTKWMIKQDPLSVMDRFADYLTNKLEKMKKAMLRVSGQRETLRRSIKTLQTTVNTELERGKAAQELGKHTQAQLAGTRVKRAMDTIGRYNPQLQRMDKSIEFMSTLAENWEVSIVTMREEIEGRRTEWKMLKENARALNQAEAFIRGETHEGRLYKESIKALEEQVSRKIAYIEQFEKEAKPILEGMQIDKKMGENEGMAILDKYIKDGNLLLPDFSKLSATNLDFQMVPAATPAKPTTGKFKL